MKVDTTKRLKVLLQNALDILQEETGFMDERLYRDWLLIELGATEKELDTIRESS